MTDPYLLSASDDAPVPATPADRIDELARKMRVPRTMLEDMPPEILDHMEQSAARMEADEEAWGDLADSVARKLTAACSGDMIRLASAAGSIFPCGRTA